MEIDLKIIEHFGFSAKQTSIDLGIKEYQSTRLLSRYCSCVAEIIVGEVIRGNKLTSGVTLSWDRLREDVGQVVIDGQRIWALPLLQKHCPLLVPLDKSSNIT